MILPGIQETVQHATVISGYDDSTNRVLMYFPEPDKIGANTYKQFNELWKQDDNVTMMIVPNDVSNVLEKDSLEFTESNRLCFMAEKLYLRGKYDEAVSTLIKAKELEPKNPRTWSQLGTLYNERNKEECVQCYQQAIKLNPKYYLAYRGLGNYYLKKKDYANAEKYYSHAISINEFRFGPIYKNRAVAMLELGKKEDAIDDLSKYLAQCPNAPDRKSVQEMVKQLRNG